jgi:Domain of unknown function (DUF1924)
MLNRPLSIALAALSFILPALAAAGPREDLLTRYAAQARSGRDFSSFSSERLQVLHTRKFGDGKPDTPACTSCHSPDPRRPGQTPAGKPINPVAVSAAPARYTDPAKVEKWFRRNCNEVLGRECTAIEKGDWLTYMMKQ